MEEEHCPNCHRHCPKSNLHCDRGRRHFGVQPAKGDSGLTDTLVQLERQFKECGDKSAFFSCLTESELSILKILLGKVKDSHEKK